MGLCDKCKSRAVIYQKYSGMHLCSSHFDEDVHRKVREYLRKTNLFGRGSRLAVVLDGGKDGLVLLHILKSFFGCRKDIEFRAIILDENKENTLHLQAEDIVKKMNVPCAIKKLPRYGVPIPEDDFAKHYIDLSRKTEIINEAVGAIDADILVTGHNLDDEATDIFMNYLGGNIDGLSNILFNQKGPGKIPWIKPLQRVPDREVRLYAILHGLYYPMNDTSSEKTIHDTMRGVLNDFDAKHPGTKYSLLAGLEKVMRIHDRTDAGAKPLSDDAK